MKNCPESAYLFVLFMYFLPETFQKMYLSSTCICICICVCVIFSLLCIIIKGLIAFRDYLVCVVRGEYSFEYIRTCSSRLQTMLIIQCQISCNQNVINTWNISLAFLACLCVRVEFMLACIIEHVISDRTHIRVYSRVHSLWMSAAILLYIDWDLTQSWEYNTINQS